MERATITVSGPADRLVADGLGELVDVLDRLGGAALIVGGLMTRIWLHARPHRNMPTRATADVDLGIDRRSLSIASNRRVIGPLLAKHEFIAGMGDKAFRYSKELPNGSLFRVDLLVAPGASRADPPLLETGIPTVAAPGLAYAFFRGAVTAEVTFVDGSGKDKHLLRIPELDAAFVLKGALVGMGVRPRPDIARIDTTDAVMLAALCLDDAECIRSLAKHRRRSDVRSSLRFLESIDGPRTRAARRVERHFAIEFGISGAGEWASDVARQLTEAVKRR